VQAVSSSSSAAQRGRAGPRKQISRASSAACGGRHGSTSVYVVSDDEQKRVVPLEQPVEVRDLDGVRVRLVEEAAVCGSRRRPPRALETRLNRALSAASRLRRCSGIPAAAGPRRRPSVLGATKRMIDRRGAPSSTASRQDDASGCGEAEARPVAPSSRAAASCSRRPMPQADSGYRGWFPPPCIARTKIGRLERHSSTEGKMPPERTSQRSAAPPALP